MKRRANNDERRYDVEEYRKKKKLRKVRNLVVTGLAVVVLLGAALAVVYVYRNYDIEQFAMTTRAPAETAVLRDSTYPIALNGINPMGLSQLGDHVVMLTSDESVIFNRDGGMLHNFNHRFTNPVQKTGGGRLFTYDRGGFSYRIDSAGGLHNNSRTTGTIQTGAISSKQSYAIATLENRYAGSVTVYNKSNDETLKWFSVSEQIVDLDFSVDGSKLAVSCVGFDKNAVSAKIYVFDLKKSEEEPKSFTFTDALPVALDYKENGAIHMICDSSIAVVDTKGESQQTIPFANQIYQFTFSGGETFLVSSDANRVSYSLLSLTAKNELKTIMVNGDALDLSANDSRVYILDKGTVQIYESDLTFIGEFQIKNDMFQISTSGNMVYLLGANTLDKVFDDLEVPKS